MNLTKLNLIAYRIVGIAIALFLVVGSVGIIVNRLYLRGIIGLIAAGIITWMMFRTPSIKSWGVILGTLLISMYLIGVINSYEINGHI